MIRCWRMTSSSLSTLGGLKRSGTRGDINSVRNPQVRAAIHDVMRLRLRRDVDGFRVDVLWHLIKDDLLRAPR
jgi:glycosidase